jgi:ADP-ribose pyrophosphatase YjhB (NUDIX family)
MPDEIRPGTNGVVFNENEEVLLHKRSDNGWWALPGGVVDIGESIEQCVIREVLEETGLEVAVKRLVGIYSDPRHYSIMRYPDDVVVHYVVAVFECARQLGELGISEESTDIGYFPVDSLPENTMLSTQFHIRDTVTNRAEPFIR